MNIGCRGRRCGNGDFGARAVRVPQREQVAPVLQDGLQLGQPSLRRERKLTPVRWPGPVR